MFSRPVRIAASILALACLAACAGGGSPESAAPAPAPPAAAPAPTQAPAPAAPQLTQEEMMANWQKAMTPGPMHAKLEAFVGTWDASVSWTMAPGAPPEVSTGTSVNQWILGGRFLEQKFAGTTMGGPFEGVGYTGYDNVQGKYVGTWIDNMGTGIMTSAGDMDAAGTTLTSEMTAWDPMTGKKTTARSTVTIEGPDRHVMAMYSPDPATGQEFKGVEITYTRKAAP